MDNTIPLPGIQDPVVQESNRKMRRLLENGMSFGSKDMDKNTIQHFKKTILELLNMSNVQLTFSSSERFLQVLETTDLNSVDDNSGLTPLMACAVLGRCDLGLKLIQKGASVNVKTKYGLNTMMIACLLEEEDFVDMLLKETTMINYAVHVSAPAVEPDTNFRVDSVSSTTALKQANINVANNMGVTALLYAVLADNEEIVENLISSGASVNASTKDGTTALHLASVKRSNDILQALLTAGCDFNAKTLDGNTPLIWAVQFNHTDTAQILLESGACVNETNILGNTALHMAAVGKHSESVTLLLNHAADCSQTNKKGQTPLMLAAFNGCEYIVDKLIKHMHNKSQALVNFTDKRGQTALFYASWQGCRHVVKLLIEAQANPHACDYSGTDPLMAACRNGHEKVVKMLLNIKPHPLDHRYLLALDTAVKGRHTNAVNIMLPRKEKIKCLIRLQEILPEEVKACPLLHTAAGNGDVDIIKALLHSGAHINSHNRLGQTALLVAAKARHAKVVKYLIQNGADINSCDLNGDTPLILVSHNGCTLTVKMLLDKKADSTLRNLAGRSALMEAANSGCHEIVKMLCEVNNVNNNIDEKERIGWTPLMLAAQHGFASIVQLLIERCASVHSKSKSGVTAVMISSGNGKVSTTRLLIEKGANINEEDKNGRTSLLYAASQGYSQIVEVLIERGADVNSNASLLGLSPLGISTFNGYLATTEILLKAGADVNLVNIDGSSCLHFAALGGHHHLVKLLHEYGVAVDVTDAHKITPLILAAYKGDARSVRYLIDKGADCNRCFSDGLTPLMFCSQEGHLECMQALLDTSGINIDFSETLGLSALSISAANGRHSAVHLLLKREAKKDKQDNFDQTPLMLSTYTGHIDVVETLIESKASLDLKDKDGKTALIIAAETNRRDIVEVLLKAGAEINATSNNKVTALQASVQNANMEIVKLLVSYQAGIDIADVEGNTPLMSSARTGNNLILKHLLHANADITKQNKEGKTAIDMCIERNNSVAVQYLCQKGPIAEADKEKYIAVATKFKRTELLRVLNQARTDDSCQTAIQDTDSELFVANYDEGDNLKDFADEVTKRSSGTSAQGSSTNTTINKDSNGIFVGRTTRTKEVKPIKSDPTGTLNLQSGTITPLIVNITNNITEAQNVAIGDFSSISCVTQENQETMCSVDGPVTGANLALSDRCLSFIASNVGGVWTAVLLQLGVPLPLIDQLQNSHQHNVHLQIVSALRWWRENDSRSPEDKLNSLFEVLTSEWIGQKELVEQCKRHFKL